MLRALVFGFSALLVWCSAPAEACAPVFPEGQAVTISGEEALIVWDAEAGIEHFIRRASFRTDATDFGFLVPTPTPPELSEVSDAVFDRLSQERQPPVTYTHDWEPMTCCMAPFFLIRSGAAEPALEASAVMVQPAVEVLAEARVAGMDATVVRANDPDALGAWLGERGYDNRPALVDWLAPYVTASFAITAFKFSKEAAETEVVGSQAIRMSFETDTPYYPYREPSDHPEEPYRALWLHVVAAERAAGSLESGDDWPTDETIYTAPIEDPSTLLGDSLSGVDGDLWLSTIIDRAEARQDADLRFDISAGEAIRPEPIVRQGNAKTLWLPIEPVVLLGAGVWWWRRRKSRAEA